jgi:hypothetical protein
MSKDVRPLPSSSAAPARYGADGAGSVPGGTASPADVARYIAEFSAELSCLAREAKLDLLAYLLDMARHEAVELSRPQQGTGR